TADGTIRVRSVRGPNVLEIEAHHGLPVTALAFSADGQSLISGGSDSEIRVWDLATGESVLRLRGHEHGVTALALSPGGSMLVSAGQGTRIMLWDARTGKLQGVISGHSDFVEDLAFSPDGTRLASAGAD